MSDERNRTEPSTLYLVATPIGNLSDVSDRARKVLSEVDFVAAEDTRNTGKLLACLGIHTRTVSYHEHNKRQSGERIVERLLAGESCALVTDAGMPAVSDPGEDLVRSCAAAGLPVTLVPGPCAAVSALSLSALSTRRFVFEGFLPMPRTERQQRLAQLSREARTVILYEAPHRLCRTLDELMGVMGADRRLALCRELTKKNEEILRMTLKEACAYYQEREPRGEYVLVLEGCEEAGIPTEMDAQSSGSDATLPPQERIRRYEEDGMPRMEAMKTVAREMGISKSELYRRLHTED